MSLSGRLDTLVRSGLIFMKTYKVKIKGLTPYMQHRMDDQKLDAWEKLRGPIMERPEVSHEDAVRAEYHCYRNKEGKCFIPGDHIRGSLIGAGGYLKAKVRIVLWRKVKFRALEVVGLSLQIFKR